MIQLKIQQVKKSLLKISDSIEKLIDIDRFYAVIFDFQNDEIVFPFVKGKTIDSNKRKINPEILPDFVLQKKNPILYEDDIQIELKKERVRYWPDDSLPLSWLSVPIIFDNNIIGLLVAENLHKKKAFGDAGIKRLQTISRQIAVAIESSILNARLKRKVQLMTATHNLGKELTSQLQLDELEILELIHKRATDIMDTNNMYIALYYPNPEKIDEPEKGLIYGMINFELMYVEERGEESENINSLPESEINLLFELFELEYPLNYLFPDTKVKKKEKWSRKAELGKLGRTEEIIITRKPILIRNRKESIAWYRQPGREEFIGEPFSSWVGVPILKENKVYGVIATYHKYKDYLYDEDDLMALSMMANSAAIAIENVRLYEDAEDHSQKLKALQEISIKITSNLDLNDVLGSIAEYVNTLMNAYFTTLFVYDNDQEKFIYKLSRGMVTDEPSTPSRNGLSATIIKKKEFIFEEYAEKQPLIKQIFIEKKKLKSFIGIPLICRERAIGVLYINYSIRHFFSKEEREFVELMANQAAVAIYNATLYRSLENANRRIAEDQDLLTRSLIATDFVHRLKNLTGTIPFWTELIEDQLTKEKPSIEKINNYSQNIKKDVKFILESSEQFKKQNKNGPIDMNFLLNSLIRHIRIQYRKEIESDQFDLTSNINDNLHNVYGLSSTLANALYNVISNGIEAIFEKKIKGDLNIIAQNESLSTGEQFVKIKINDNGIGINEEIYKRIFEHFSTKGGIEHGYGLWNAKRVIMDTMKGTIKVLSEKEIGTTFFIMLPKYSEEITNDTE